MAYIVQADLLEQISNAQLIQLTDDLKTGAVDTDKVTRAITSGDAEIDGYVATRHSVPLAAPVPNLIKSLAVTIAIYNLYRRRQRAPEDVRTAYEDAVKKLEGIARGLITLGIDPPPAESSKATKGAVSGPARIFDRDKLGNF